MKEIGLLVWVRYRGFRNRFAASRLSDMPATIATLVVFGGFFIGVFVLSRWTTLYFLQTAHIGSFLTHRFLAMVLYVLFVTVNLGNVIICYATFYRSEEVSFLMGLPLRAEQIFLAKFLDNFFSSSITMIMIGTALFLGYASAFHLPWGFYLAAPLLVNFPFLLLSGIIAVVTIVLLIAFAARTGARRLMGLSILAYMLLVYAYFKVTNPIELVNAVMRHYPYVNGYFGELDPFVARYLPNYWVAEFLYWTVSGNLGRAMHYAVALNASTAGLLIVLWYVGRTLYYRSWLGATESQASRRSSNAATGDTFFAFHRQTFPNRQDDVLLKRDFWLFFRDPNQWVHFLLMILLLTVFVLSMSAVEFSSAQRITETATYVTLLLFNGFLVSSVALRFVFPAVSQEGLAFWCVRSAPVNLGKLYWQKFLWSLALVLTVSLSLSIASAVLTRQHPVLSNAATISMASVAVAITSMYLGSGAIFAQFKERNPIRVASSRGATVTFLLSMLYLVVVTGVITIPAYQFYSFSPGPGASAAAIWYLPLAFVAGMSLIIASLYTYFGLRSLSRDYA
jgi:ABC-2 type transport system permease protein